MKKFIAIVLVLGAIGFFGWKFYNDHKPDKPLGGGSVTQFYYTSATQATTSVGTYAWTNILTADQGRGFVSLCNDSLAANSAIYLGLGATSTPGPKGMLGIRVPSGSCYEMTPDKMFFGNVYAIASSSTSTVLSVSASY